MSNSLSGKMGYEKELAAQIIDLSEKMFHKMITASLPAPSKSLLV
jgi:hypothetical protein